MKMISAEQALLPDGWTRDVDVGIADDGRIAFVNQNGNPDFPANRVEKVSVSVLLPAPVNVHSHAFQRAMAGLTEKRGPDPADSFWSWRKLMYEFLDRLTPDDIESITSFVQMEMLEAGFATHAEFHYLHKQPGGGRYDNLAELADRIAAAAVSTGIGLTLLPVHYQYGGCDCRPLERSQKRFGTDLSEFENLWTDAANTVSSLSADSCVGVAPHSLRAVSPESLAALQNLAPAAPFHMHLAEQQAEVEEVRQILGARPVEWLLDNADVDGRWCLIHCTQMLPHETASLAQSGAVAGLCPITEFNLGDGIFDAVNYLNAGGLISIGSDSNIRISLNEELRLLEYSQRLRDHSRAALASREMSAGRRIFDQVSQGGAQAAGRKSGRIEPGYWADLIALNGEHSALTCRSEDALLDSFIFAGDDRLVSDVWSAGRHQVEDGQHINRVLITESYKKVIRKLEKSL